MNIWQLQNSENRLNEIVAKATTQGPQLLIKDGVETAVVLSIDDYRRLTQHRMDLVDFFRNSPLVEADLDLEREEGVGRETDF